MCSRFNIPAHLILLKLSVTVCVASVAQINTWSISLNSLIHTSSSSPRNLSSVRLGCCWFFFSIYYGFNFQYTMSFTTYNQVIIKSNILQLHDAMHRKCTQQTLIVSLFCILCIQLCSSSLNTLYKYIQKIIAISCFHGNYSANYVFLLFFLPLLI